MQPERELYLSERSGVRVSERGRGWEGFPLRHLCGTAGPPDQVRRRRLWGWWRISTDFRLYQPRRSRAWPESLVSHAWAAPLGRRIKSGGDVCGGGGGYQQISVFTNHVALGLNPRAQSPTPERHCWAAGSSPAATSVGVVADINRFPSLSTTSLSGLTREPSLPRLSGTPGPPDQVRRRRLWGRWWISTDFRLYQPRLTRAWPGCPVSRACAAPLVRRIQSGGNVSVGGGAAARRRCAWPHRRWEL